MFLKFPRILTNSVNTSFIIDNIPSIKLNSYYQYSVIKIFSCLWYSESSKENDNCKQRPSPSVQDNGRKRKRIQVIYSDSEEDGSPVKQG